MNNNCFRIIIITSPKGNFISVNFSPLYCWMTDSQVIMKHSVLSHHWMACLLSFLCPVFPCSPTCVWKQWFYDLSLLYKMPMLIDLWAWTSLYHSKGPWKKICRRRASYETFGFHCAKGLCVGSLSRLRSYKTLLVSERTAPWAVASEHRLSEPLCRRGAGVYLPVYVSISLLLEQLLKYQILSRRVGDSTLLSQSTHLGRCSWV